MSSRYERNIKKASEMLMDGRQSKPEDIVSLE